MPAVLGVDGKQAKRLPAGVVSTNAAISMFASINCDIVEVSKTLPAMTNFLLGKLPTFSKEIAVLQRHYPGNVGHGNGLSIAPVAKTIFAINLLDFPRTIDYLRLSPSEVLTCKLNCLADNLYSARNLLAISMPSP